MPKIGIFYATISKSTKKVAELIASSLNVPDNDVYNLIDIESVDIMLNYDLLILGSPTYGKGDCHYLWRETFKEMKAHNFQHIYFAIFSLGDQVYHSKTFAGAITKMNAALQEQKTTMVGGWSAEGYEFTNSPIVVDNENFSGLVIDEKNQSQLTKSRVIKWCQQLSNDFAQF